MEAAGRSGTPPSPPVSLLEHLGALARVARISACATGSGGGVSCSVLPRVVIVRGDACCCVYLTSSAGVVLWLWQAGPCLTWSALRRDLCCLSGGVLVASVVSVVQFSLGFCCLCVYVWCVVVCCGAVMR